MEAEEEAVSLLARVLGKGESTKLVPITFLWPVGSCGVQFSSSPALPVQRSVSVIDTRTWEDFSAETLPPDVHPIQKPGMRDDGFKYQPGDIVTHVGFLKPIRHAAVPRFQVIAQTLEMAPHGPQRYYYIRPATSRNSGVEGTTDTIRVQEDHLASLQEEE